MEFHWINLSPSILSNTKNRQSPNNLPKMTGIRMVIKPEGPPAL